MSGAYRQNSFAPILKSYNQKLSDLNLPDRVEIYGLKYLAYDQSFRYYHAVDRTHRHSFWEVHVLEEGKQNYVIDNERVTLNSGEFLLIAPGVPHCQIFKEEFFSKFSLMLRPVNGYMLFNAEELLLIGYGKLVTPDGMNKILRYLFETVGIDGKDSLACVYHCMQLFLISLTACLSEQFEMKKEQTGAGQPVYDRRNEAELCEKAVQYLQENISKILTIQEVAEHFFISERHLNRKFKAYYGKTFGEIAKELRCDYARDLLRYSNLSVEEISERVGFGNSSSFIHFFRREEGQSPGNFRNSFHEANYGRI